MDNFFKLQERGTTVSREIIGGVTTFLAMSYILAVNPGILSGTFAGTQTGLAWGSVFTATAVSAAVATLVMAFCAALAFAAFGDSLDNIGNVRLKGPLGERLDRMVRAHVAGTDPDYITAPFLEDARTVSAEQPFAKSTPLTFVQSPD